MIYGYCRVSTDDQSISLDNQRQELEAHAEKLGRKIDRIFLDEDVSGKVPLRDRPQGKVMWDLLEKGDLVLVTKLDRGWRNTADAAGTLATWRQYGVKLSILDFPIDTATDEGEMMFCQFASWAQYERKRIGRRVSDAFGYLKRNGKPYAGTRPFGWVRGDKEWVPCERERVLGNRVVDMRDRGMSWNAITLCLCREGVRKPATKKTSSGWYHPPDVRSLCRAARAGYPAVPQASWLGAQPEETPPAAVSHGPLTASAG